MKHTKEEKKRMSERRKLWWKTRTPEERAKTCAKIKANHARPALGKRGPLSSGWKGGKWTTKRDKYIHVYAPDHPNARKGGTGGGGYVLEHRLVMEKHLGRYLEKTEDVHHLNGNKKDNRIENLILVPHNQHYHDIDCPKCGFNFRLQ